MKIAVASSDGKVINQHFGHAEKFYIFESGEDNFQYIGFRTGKSFCNCGEHDDRDLEDAISLISHCKYVLASQIGFGAQKALADRGIDIKVTRGFIDDCVKQLFDDLHQTGE